METITTKQINTVKSLEQLLYRSSIPHARVLSRWVFEKLIPSHKPGTPHWILKNEVEVDTGITFQGRTFSSFIALLIKKKLITEIAGDKKGQYHLGATGRCISQRVVVLEEQMRVVHQENVVRDEKIDQILRVVLEKLDPPYTPERAARWLAENVKVQELPRDEEFPG